MEPNSARNWLIRVKSSLVHLANVAQCWGAGGWVRLGGIRAPMAYGGGQTEEPLILRTGTLVNKLYFSVSFLIENTIPGEPKEGLNCASMLNPHGRWIAKDCSDVGTWFICKFSVRPGKTGFAKPIYDAVFKSADAAKTITPTTLTPPIACDDG